MSSVLHFKNSSYFDDNTERTIAGAQFRTLMELCFAQADTFSLLRCGWPGARDGALEQALRPWLVGEYASYGILHWFDRQSREKCYLYRATQETKEILLQHIHHLFEAEQSLAPAGHQAYLEEKYAVYDRASEKAWDRFSAYMEAEGQEQSEEQQNAVLLGLYKKAREGCPDIFSEGDHYSNMEHPCFSGEMRCSLRPSPMSRSAGLRCLIRSLKRPCGSWESGWTYPGILPCPCFPWPRLRG